MLFSDFHKYTISLSEKKGEGRKQEERGGNGEKEIDEATFIQIKTINK